MIMLKVPKEIAEKYDGYKNGVCQFDTIIVGGNYYTGVAAKEQFPDIDFSEAIEADVIVPIQKELD